MLSTNLFNTIYILVYVILSVLHVADLLRWRYILSRPLRALNMYIPSTAVTLTSIFAALRKNTECRIHMQMHRCKLLFCVCVSLFLCCFDPIVSFVVLLMSVNQNWTFLTLFVFVLFHG